jgi:hypothetical protein
MDKWNLFISYEWESKELVHQICDDLEKAGFTLWIDRHEVIPGQSIYEKIQKGINKSEVVLAFVTLKYCSSRSCQQEILFANSIKDKKVLYIVLEKINRQCAPNGMGLLLTQKCYYGLYNKKWSNEELNNLKKAITEINNQSNM